MWETWIWSLGWEDPLEEGMATHPSILGLPLWLSWWRIHLQCRRPQFNSWLRKIPWRRDRLPTPVFLGFPGDLDDKESACNVGDLSLIPGLGRSPGGGHGNPLQHSGLENPHGQRSLAGYSPQGHKEWNMTEQLSHTIMMTLFYWSKDKYSSIK